MLWLKINHPRGKPERPLPKTLRPKVTLPLPPKSKVYLSSSVTLPKSPPPFLAVEVKPAPVAPVTKPKITNDELQISVKEFHAKLGVPPSFRELNQQRLAAVVGEVKVSELKFDKATRDPAYLNQWMKWAISEYKKLAVTSKK